MKRAGAALSAGLSAALHCLAVVEFAAHRPTLGLPEEWTLDFLVLAGLSGLLVVAMYLVPSGRVRVAAAVARIVVLVLAGVPYGGFLDIRFLLLASFLVDVFARVDAPARFILAACALGSWVIFLFRVSVFSVLMPAPSLLDWSVSLLMGTCAAVLLAGVRRGSDRQRALAERVDALNEVITKLMGSSRDYLEYATRVQRETTEKERARITQDLHDVVGQAFTNIYAMMDASLKHPPSGSAETTELHTWARDQSRKGLDETRAILYQLRSIREREPSGIAAIRNLVDTFRHSTRLAVRVEWGNLPWSTGGELDSVLYRLVQESLVNAFRHGNATEIMVHFWVGDDLITLDINDNGRGAPSGKKGIGQESMENQAATVGGSVTFTATTQGYNVHASFPRRLAGEAAGGP